MRSGLPRRRRTPPSPRLPCIYYRFILKNKSQPQNSSSSLVVQLQVCIIFAWGGPHAEILEKPGRVLPPPLPTYLPTYLPYLWGTKKRNQGGVKVGYYTN